MLALPSSPQHGCLIKSARARGEGGTKELYSNTGRPSGEAPCLNEADTVAACVGMARRALAEAGITGEVIVADNGSTDGSSTLTACRPSRWTSFLSDWGFRTRPSWRAAGSELPSARGPGRQRDEGSAVSGRLTSSFASRYLVEVSKSGVASIDTPYPSVDDVAEGLGISRTRARRAADDLRTLLDRYERSLIEAALQTSHGNQRRAARTLGILPTTLYEKMRRLGLLRRTRLDENEEVH